MAFTWSSRISVRTPGHRAALLALYAEAFPASERKSEAQLFHPVVTESLSEAKEEASTLYGSSSRLHCTHWIWEEPEEIDNSILPQQTWLRNQGQTPSPTAPLPAAMGISVWIGNHAGEPVCFIEYLAVSQRLRGKQLATTLLKGLQQDYGQILIEVEPETDTPSLANRRIAWYERNGFCRLPDAYWMPNLHNPGSPLTMQLMLWKRSTKTPTLPWKIGTAGTDWQTLLHAQVYAPCLTQGPDQKTEQRSR